MTTTRRMTLPGLYGAYWMAAKGTQYGSGGLQIPTLWALMQYRLCKLCKLECSRGSEEEA